MEHTPEDQLEDPSSYLSQGNFLLKKKFNSF